MSDRLVIYHGKCIDGFTSAWVAWTKWGPDAEYIGASYGEEPPDVRGRDVLIVDFSYKRSVLERMAEEARSLRVLDHHKTAEEDLRGLPFCLFDMERSGAGIAWDDLRCTERPWLVDYVEDRDLWRWELPDSRAVSAYISTVEQTFPAWSHLAAMPLSQAAERGAAVVSYIDRYVQEMSAQARWVEFEGHRVPVVNAPYLNTSELVGALAEAAPFAVGWFQRQDGKYQHSLRSRGDGAVDVSEVAKRYGGGGHRNAAGFITEERVV